MSSHQDDIQTEIARFNEMCAREGNGCAAKLILMLGTTYVVVANEAHMFIGSPDGDVRKALRTGLRLCLESRDAR